MSLGETGIKQENSYMKKGGNLRSVKALWCLV